ncbi:MAG: hypothetical protein KDC69_09250 [Flavobacteriaceae bacterium]|nr:hypothetical protein [Flavobacteriaceae bacterium]
MKKSYVLFFLVSFVYSCMLSQEASNEKLKIFIEGKVLDFNYMRNNIPFVSFVNDPQASEVHVIITRQITGGGGFLFTLEYNSMEFPNVPKLRLTCKTFSFDTKMIIKEKLVKTLQAGLLPFFNEKNGMQEIDIMR